MATNTLIQLTVIQFRGQAVSPHRPQLFNVNLMENIHTSRDGIGTIFNYAQAGANQTPQPNQYTVNQTLAQINSLMRTSIGSRALIGSQAG